MRDVGVCIERVDADLALAAVRHFRNETRHAVDQMAAGDGVAVCGEHHAAAHAEQVAARIIARQFEHRRAAFLEDLVRRKHIFRLLARADLDLLSQARHRHARQDGGRFAAADGIVRLEPAAVRAGQHTGTVEQIDRVRVLCRGGNIRDRAVRDTVDGLERAARERPGQHGRKFTAARVRVIICKRPGQDAVALRVVHIGLIPRRRGRKVRRAAAVQAVEARRQLDRLRDGQVLVRVKFSVVVAVDEVILIGCADVLIKPVGRGNVGKPPVGIGGLGCEIFVAREGGRERAAQQRRRQKQAEQSFFHRNIASIEMLFAFRRTGVTPRMLRRSRRCTWCDNRGRRTIYRRSLRSCRPGR